MDALSRHFYRWEASVPFMPTYNLLLRVALYPGPGPGPGPPPALFNIACPNVSYCRAVLHTCRQLVANKLAQCNSNIFLLSMC